MSTRLTNRGKKNGHRRGRDPASDVGLGYNNEDTGAKKESSRGAAINLGAIVLISIGIVSYILHGLSDGSAASQSVSAKSEQNVRSNNRSAPKGERFVIDEKRGIDLFVDLAKSLPESSFAHGPHSATLLISTGVKPSTGCSSSNIKFWFQYEGDAMGTAILTTAEDNTDSTSNELSGEFSFPVSGSYQLVSYFAGCGDTGDGKVTRSVLKEGLNVVVDNANEPVNSKPSNDPYLTSNLYPKAAWIASHKVNSKIDKTVLPYVWHDPSVSEPHMIKTQTPVSKDGAVFEKSGFFQFSQLSNYELVCWVGSESAAASREAFLEERKKIAGNQRPFKFHFYNTSSFLRPVEAWPTSYQTRFRKCKHILVVMDEIQNDPDTGKPLTQLQYADQATIFLHHIEKAFPDETFPIWMFTVSESPVFPTSCVSRYYLPRSSHHPCNDVLFDLFDSKKPKKFSNRVHLLDNTMISLPQSLLQSTANDDSSSDNAKRSKSVITATIALRIFVLVGKKVDEWRAAGQVGLINGLHRMKDGQKIVEPNFELIPYTWR